jgi:hypothetical protein
VPSRGDNAKMVLGNPGGHKTLPYRNVRYARMFLSPGSALNGLRCWINQSFNLSLYLALLGTSSLDCMCA